MRPEGANATEFTNVPGTGMAASGDRLTGSHSCRFWPPAASIRPSGLNATLFTGLPAISTGDGSNQDDTVPSASPAASRDKPSQASEVTGSSCGSCAVSDRVARFHTRALLSLLPAARRRPSGLKATAFTQSVAPLSEPSGSGRAGARTFHSQTLSSWLPAASTCPFGLKATDVTMFAGPVSALPSGMGREAPLTDHSRTVLSAQPAASRRPSGLNATDST